MKYNIRHKVWETNSSSTHSMTIDSQHICYDSIIPNNKGEIELVGREFGWEWEKYHDPITKASYCAIHAKNSVRKIKMLKKVIKKHTGTKKVIMDIDGYHIDHQSLDIANEAFESEETLKNFIFNRNSILFTGNDNSNEPDGFKNINIVDNETDEIRIILKEMGYKLDPIT